MFAFDRFSLRIACAGAGSLDMKRCLTDSHSCFRTIGEADFASLLATADYLLRCKLDCVSDSQLLAVAEERYSRLSVQVTLSVGRRAR